MWDATTLRELARFEHHERYVSPVAFTPDGTKLLTVGGDDNHTMCLWAWGTDVKRPIFEYASGKEEVCGLTFKAQSATIYECAILLFSFCFSFFHSYRHERHCS